MKYHTEDFKYIHTTKNKMEQEKNKFDVEK